MGRNGTRRPRRYGADLGLSQLLGTPVDDLSGAKLTNVRGRGSVALHADKASLSVTFDDPEPGADVYEVVLNLDK